MAGYEVTIVSEGQAIGAGIDTALFVGPQGPKGDRGEMGPVGPEGPQGSKGDRGETGPQGERGPQGIKGDKGDTGDVGPQGLQGERGPQGNKGDKGDKGDTGAGFVVLGYYASASALAASVASPSTGDAYGVGNGEPYDIYIWDGVGTAWVNNGPLQGAKGEKGDKGDAGPQGPQGTTGPKGDKGDVGAKGDKGDTGPQGETGPKGDKGDTGAKGDKGDTGPQGPQGLKGDPGAQGGQGPQGPAGADGVPGPNEVSTSTATTITGLLKGNGGAIAPAVAGTDYAGANHTHSNYITKEGGTMTGALVAGGALDVAVAQVRNIYAGTADMTPGTTALPTGSLYFMYE